MMNKATAYILLVLAFALAPRQSALAANPTYAQTWPTYFATDYAKSGHPSLTKKQVDMIRFALSKVKACQKPLLRYAFPANASFGLPFVLFFEPRTSTEVAHVFWTNGTYYRNDGVVFASPEGVPRVSPNMEYDIDNTKCSSS